MARTINEIEQSITGKLQNKLSLSSSGVAEWRLWVSVCATAIHVFELILDRFKKDVEENVMTSRPGTRKWWERLCFLFQNNHTLVWDEKDATLKYLEDDASARITAVANVNIAGGIITLRVAKNDNGKLVPFNAGERGNFTNYINESKPLGTQVVVLSTTPDSIRYNAVVYYNPAFPLEQVRERVTAAIDAFKLSQEFGGILYPERFMDAMIQAEGVVTVKLNSILRKGTSQSGYSDVNVSASLEAGYFDYDNGNSIITFESI